MSKAMHFEKSMRELEEIVANLEKGEQSLETCLKLYEKGMGLARKCEESLDYAAKKIESLQKQSLPIESSMDEPFSDE